MTGEQLRTEYTISNLTADDFANKIGIGKTKLYAQFKLQVIDDAVAVAFNKSGLSDKKYTVSVQNDSDENDFKSNAKLIDLEHTRNNMYMVPIKAQGGFFNGYADSTYLDSLERYPFPFVRGKCFAFEVEGFSMVNESDPRNSYYPGDWVVCTQVENFSWLAKNKVYVFVTVNGICIKQFDKIEDNKFYLKSFNKGKEYDVKPIPIKEVKMALHIEKRMIQ